MTPLTLIITRAGMAKFTAAQLTAGLDLTIAAVGLTDQPIVAAPTLTALPGEFRRLTMVSGAQVGDAIVHLTMRDDAEIGYTARGFGLFLADGTLFAAYGQDDALFQKSPRATFLAAVDIAFPTGDISRLTFGNTDFLNAPATTEAKGVVELATPAEVDAGTDTGRVITVALLARAVKALKEDVIASIAQALDGLAARTVYGSGLVKGGGRNDVNRTLTVDAATGAETRSGTRADVALTPAALSAALERGGNAKGQWRRTLDNVLEAWGETLTTASQDEPVITVELPIAFPSASYFVQLTPLLENASDGKDSWVQLIRGSKTETSFKVQVQRPGTSGTSFGLDGFEWSVRY